MDCVERKRTYSAANFTRMPILYTRIAHSELDSTSTSCMTSGNGGCQSNIARLVACIPLHRQTFLLVIGYMVEKTGSVSGHAGLCRPMRGQSLEITRHARATLRR
jgi:hypothetical protein